MGKLDNVELAPDRVDKRNLVAVLLDTSGSMSGDPIAELNTAFRQFIEVDLPEQPVIRRTGELAVGTFSHDRVIWLHLAQQDVEGSHPFYFVQHLGPREGLSAYGATPMGTAILVGLQAIEHRKEQLRLSKPPKSHEHRPVLYLVTDGQPYGESKRRMDEAREALQAAELSKKVLFFSLGTAGADMDRLATLSVGGSDNAYDLKDQPLSALLEFVSRSSEATFTAEEDASNLEGTDQRADLTGINDPRDPRLMYRFVRSKYEDEFWSRLNKSDFAQ